METVSEARAALSVKRCVTMAAGCALGVALWPASGFAQPALDAAGTASGTDDFVLEEIVVTAQRRSEKLQDVPIAIAAITADALATQGVGGTLDISQSVAGVNVTSQSGSIFPRIRGVGNSIIGPGFENGVAVYVDGVYFGSTQASILSLNNIRQIEVLKGPQGTLFGRNTTGGLIHVISRDPEEEAGGEAKLSYGNYQTLAADAYVTGALAPNLAADLAGHFSTQGDGYGANRTTGKDVYRQNEDVALRSSALLTPSDGARFRLTGDYARNHGSMFARRPAPGTRPALPTVPLDSVWDTATGRDPENRFKGWGVSGRWDQDVDFAQLASITAFRKSRNFSGQDGDMSPTPGINLMLTQKDQQFSQEVQLASNPGSDLTWIVGAFYYNSRGRFDPAEVQFFGPVAPVLPFGVMSTQITSALLKTESAAAFAQATLPVAEATNLTLGARYTAEKRSIDAQQVANLASGVKGFPLSAVSGNKHFSKPTWRVSLDHRFSPEWMTYVSYNRGFKSGGFNGAAPTSPAFAPEVLDAFETGVKSDLLDRSLRLNVAAFYYKYKNIQVSRYPPGATIIYNGASARIYGVDADLEARITSQFSLSAGMSLSSNKFTRFPDAYYFLPAAAGGNSTVIRDGTGNHLPEAPEFTANVNASYTIPVSIGEVGLSVSYSYNDGYYAQPDNVFAEPSFGLLNGAVTLTLDNGVDLQVWGRNLTDEKVTLNLASNNLSTAAGYRPPRTYGVSAKVTF